VVAADMLFATLDPTMRRLALPSGRTAILSDTVGFISDLPTHLVAAFRATLEEVLEADLIIHAGDIGKLAVLEKLQNLAPVSAIRGNNDRDPGPSPCRLTTPSKLALTPFTFFTTLRSSPSIQGLPVSAWSCQAILISQRLEHLTRFSSSIRAAPDHEGFPCLFRLGSSISETE